MIRAHCHNLSMDVNALFILCLRRVMMGRDASSLTMMVAKIRVRFKKSVDKLIKTKEEVCTIHTCPLVFNFGH